MSRAVMSIHPLVLYACLGGQLVAPALARAESPTRASGARAGIDRGLAFLCRQQEPAGYWRARVGRKVHVRYVGREAPHVGITALAGMSLLARLDSREEDPDRALHRRAALDALRYIVEQVGEDGFISAHASRMYSHAFATLFLARALGSELAREVPSLKTRLQRAVDLSVREQNVQGGWRYLPGAKDSDLSITATQLTALREAAIAGAVVPARTLQRGLAYVRMSHVPLARLAGQPAPRPASVFQYQLRGEAPGFASRHSFTLAACGVAALCEAGEPGAPEARAGVEFLHANRPSPQEASGRFDYYYGHYYAMRAARLMGEESWDRWSASVRGEILSLQAPDGHWADLAGPVYATAMATLILQEPRPAKPAPPAARATAR